ncbi:hypothetical protein [Georgenia subflava]|uniref:Uncharacterized protein n=1 Tax=Georgenia subflava TaxID=1622177 RepID=A0A6N7EMP3_9MICO|nr:hypothetical protein [Georgenia subflava]MPV38701.1 hypothetical protein [Georgenia subflava]
MSEPDRWAAADEGWNGAEERWTGADQGWTGAAEPEPTPLRPLWHRVLAGVVAAVLIATLVLYTALIF